MARVKGSGEQNVQTIGVRANPVVIDSFKLLADLRGTSYSREIRAALQAHLEAYRDILEKASKQVKQDVTVTANVGQLNRHIKAVVDDGIKVTVSNG